MNPAILNLTKMNIDELKEAEPYKSLFRIDRSVLESIKADMRQNGFDRSQPITVWLKLEGDEHIVIDGHTRLEAARELGIEIIPVARRLFDNEEAAIRFAIDSQNNRRNLTDADILHLVEIVDKLLPRGGDRKSIFGIPKIDQDPSLRFRPRKRKRQEFVRKLNEATVRDSRYATAEAVGISMDKVSQCRHIIQRQFQLKKEIADIMYGEKSIHKVYKASLHAKSKEELQLKKRDERQAFLEKHVRFKEFPKETPSLCYDTMESLFADLFPLLQKRQGEMEKVRNGVEFLKTGNGDGLFPLKSKRKREATARSKVVQFIGSEQGETMFDAFRSHEPMQKFLGSLFVQDFLAMLRFVGYKIEAPSGLKIIKQERPVKKKRPSPAEHCSAARFNEVGFVSKAQMERYA